MEEKETVVSGCASERKPKGTAAGHDPHAAHSWAGRTEKPESHGCSRALRGPLHPLASSFPSSAAIEAVNAHPLGSLEHGEEPKDLGNAETRAQTETWSCLPDPGASLSRLSSGSAEVPA